MHGQSQEIECISTLAKLYVSKEDLGPKVRGKPGCAGYVAVDESKATDRDSIA